MRLSLFPRATPRNYVSALHVCLIVGSVLFLINHGKAAIEGTMNRDRWISGILSYCCPFCVNLHGQCQKNSGRDKATPRFGD
ncbi:MAG: nitrate/nitrite transporter NrtS [Geitlerinemataceae cyanobacterium]